MAHEHAHIGHSHHACAESNARSYTVQPSSGSGELARFSVTVPEDLLATFDEQIPDVATSQTVPRPFAT